MDTYVLAILAGDRIQISMRLSKDRYALRQGAAHAKPRREAKTGKVLRSYHCPYCSVYHLTSRPAAPEPLAA